MVPILADIVSTNGHSSVFMLAAGVYATGFLKDLLCLPRPLSPPLARISMSGSAALEYRFPSSHSANAVSVAMYALHALRHADASDASYANPLLQAVFSFYALSILAGRLYCGMHGFLDVALGSALGAIVTALQLRYGDWMDSWVVSGTFHHVLLATLFVCLLVRIHPEPADDCPCFDDSVSFAGVVIGINLGAWHFAQTSYPLADAYPSTVPFDLASLGFLKATLRIALGVVIIFLWRATMKPTLFTMLPPLFRLLEHARLNLPRAFFLNASTYQSIQPFNDDDNVIPPASELPHMLKNLAHPRTRSVSIGPQSAADAYETLAYRNRQRRESANSKDSVMPEGAAWSPSTPALKKGEPLLSASLLPTPMASRVHSYEHVVGTGKLQMEDQNTATPPESESDVAGDVYSLTQTPTDEENEKREIFMMLTKPRVRYDVEVVTKLLIYAGRLMNLRDLRVHLTVA